MWFNTMAVTCDLCLMIFNVICLAQVTTKNTKKKIIIIIKTDKNKKKQKNVKKKEIFDDEIVKCVKKCLQ